METKQAVSRGLATEASLLSGVPASETSSQELT